MQKIVVFFFLFSFSLVAQEQIKASIKDSTIFKADKIFGVDTFGTLYYTTKNNTFHKKTKDTIITYSNFQLGEITSANTFNSLKINLFYSDFNTVIILDNRLAEIFKIDFNTISPYKNISFVSTGFDNTLWVFNQDLQQLELYDYKTNKTRLKTVPVQSNILDLKSDYNNCYMLTEKYLYIYNYFGSLISKFKNEGYESLAYSKAHLILKKAEQLYVLPKNGTEIQKIEHQNLLINQFLVTNETLYIYDSETLRQYQLKIE
ncbi:hypothetical protein H8K90_13680 [Winogradskyella echinorum]|uniref:Uncharacterized protein n=1 Tax=Winogradskyella echinorum TaxID=538189 RepID=A0ABR6Y3X1_9FLAO|nr:hypothetical protein [Winogradskyella echinorum]MBC3847441.1 hypothetical protein [Winogradskyella echinorum]MBC5751789.1 hypothetical protein [Winogradskyella echinorum]